jgi:hypothetical protein
MAGGTGRLAKMTSVLSDIGEAASDHQLQRSQPQPRTPVLDLASLKEAEYALALGREEGVSVTTRGGGTSQSGSTFNSTLIVGCSKYLDHLLELHHAEVLEPESAFTRVLLTRYGVSLEARRRPALRGRARHRARRAQPPAQAAQPLVPGRHLDRLARHHRRHGRGHFGLCARDLSNLQPIGGGEPVRSRTWRAELTLRRETGCFREPPRDHALYPRLHRSARSGRAERTGYRAIAPPPS